MNYCDFLFNVRNEWLKNIALVDVDSNKHFSYKQLQDAVKQFGSELQRLGCKKGDVFAIHLVNSAEAVIVHLGVQFIGGISCLLDPLIPVNSLSYYLNDSNSKYLFTNRTNIETKDINLKSDRIIESSQIFNLIENGKEILTDNPVEFNENDISVIFYTSGTTDKPKGVMLSPKNYFNHVKIFSSFCYNYDFNDRLLCFVPFSHGYGSKSIFLPCLKAGASMYITRSFHPYKVVEIIKKNNITHIFGVPSHYQQLLKNEEFYSTLKKLKSAFTAAALLSLDTAKMWKEQIGFYLDEGYGLIETSTGVAFRINRLPEILGDIGNIPNKFVEFRIVDEKFNKLSKTIIGEILIKSDSIMLGYLNRKQETEKVIVNGWFKSGDLGYITDDNRLILTGRKKDVINIAGVKISPFEIEGIINEYPNVFESAVIGVEDKVYGEIVIAYVKQKKSAKINERELIKYLQKYLINFQVPKRIIFINDFPRNNMGKIDKNVLRNDFLKSIKN